MKLELLITLPNEAIAINQIVTRLKYKSIAEVR